MRAEVLTQRLAGRWHGRYGTARFPAHNDNNSSLSIKDGDEGRLLLFCYAGCSYAEIISALGGEPNRGTVARGTATGIGNESRGRGLHQLIDLIWRETVSIEGGLGAGSAYEKSAIQSTGCSSRCLSIISSKSVGGLEVDLFRDLDRIGDLDIEIANRAPDFVVPEQSLTVAAEIAAKRYPNISCELDLPLSSAGANQMPTLQPTGLEGLTRATVQLIC